MPDRDWWSALWSDPEGVLRELDIPSGEVAVDLCCGDGYFTAPLCRLATPEEVYAVEIDPQILKQAQRYIAKEGVTNCVFIGADARKLAEYVPKGVGYVLLANTFHGVPDKSGISRTVHEVLRPQGRFVIVNWHPLPREQTQIFNQPRGPATQMRLSPEQTKEIVEPTGFDLKRIVELPPYHYGAVFIKK